MYFWTQYSPSKNLNISITNTSFKHPITSKNLLINNYIIISPLYSPRGFILSNGKYIGKKVLQQLIKLNEGNDFKLAHKISNRPSYFCRGYSSDECTVSCKFIFKYSCQSHINYSVGTTNI
ncbi:general transcription factor II-I repeat domain-containing protein 2-like [Aphis craccivora]|uniref:General transcription factor II-I repeat domain-containing protein 2-like n=1 Tax=Aphis craccivora TaxID=307492 RepID=A0A6G0Y5C0_APHCR|nr:general transcription factor II-I repeat domain-containing protein 2-like [Aphis craccivora]